MIQGSGHSNNDIEIQRKDLSELDKVSLNVAYCPARTSDYDPKIGDSGLYYCGREVTHK